MEKLAISRRAKPTSLVLSFLLRRCICISVFAPTQRNASWQQVPRGGESAPSPSSLQAVSSTTTPPSTSSLGPQVAAKSSELIATNATTPTTKEPPDEKKNPQEVLRDAGTRIQDLQSEQEEVWLHPDSHVPLLHFGAKADSILNDAARDLEGREDREVVLELIAQRILPLYQNQLQTLRDYYGRLYEETCVGHNTNDDIWRQEAGRCTDRFRAAAQHAIPTLCRTGQELYDAADYSYVSMLEGLLTDMMETTRMYQQEEEFAEALEETGDDDDTGGGIARRLPPWCKTLVSRALALAIQYGQGWIAWQGIQRAALQRDKEMPKFPLF